MSDCDETDSEAEWNGNYSRNYCCTDFNIFTSESIMNNATNSECEEANASARVEEYVREHEEMGSGNA